jgi:hypothetical protein
MEVRTQLCTLITLALGKEPPLFTDYGGWVDLRSGLKEVLEKRKSLASCRNHTVNPRACSPWLHVKQKWITIVKNCKPEI